MNDYQEDKFPFNPWRPNILIRDTPNWQTKYPNGPVRFDFKCIKHGTIVREQLQLPITLTLASKMFPCCYH